MRYTELDKAIQGLAATQHWLFNRGQLSALGGSERFATRRLTQSAWIKVEPAVYGLAGHPMTWRRRLKAAELGTPQSAVAGLAAAALLGFADFRPGHAELVAPPGTSSRGKIATIHREVGVLTTVAHGIRVTTPAQTLFDIAPRVGLWRLERAMDDLLASRQMATDDLGERLNFYQGSRRHGLARIRPLVLERATDGWVPPESDLEARLFRVLDMLPLSVRVVRQASWPWRPGARGRVDAFLPDAALIIEGDGRRWHTRVKDFDRDRWRDNQAVAHGLRVLRFTWTHLTTCVPDVLHVVTQAVTTGVHQQDGTVGLVHTSRRSRASA